MTKKAPKQNARHHPPETKAKAIGALWASAEEIDGVWVPNFFATGRRLGIDHTVLLRWWRGRDVSQDAESRTAAIHARVEAKRSGAREWFEGVLATSQRRVNELLDDEPRFKGAGYDEAARGTKTLVDAALKLGEALGVRNAEDGAEAGDGTGGATAVDDRVRAALERARPRE